NGRGASRNWSRRPGTTSNSTQTTGSKPITVTLDSGCDRCRSAYRPHHASDHRRARVHAEPSPRHYELATDVLHPLRVAAALPNSRERSDRSVATASRCPPFREMQQSQSVDELAVPS